MGALRLAAAVGEVLPPPEAESPQVPILPLRSIAAKAREVLTILSQPALEGLPVVPPIVDNPQLVIAPMVGPVLLSAAKAP